ncbi:acyltransferase [Candidatus Curtissbacteria bacterium]|nr:acyltransferase [Candidatus Curtissbacteria bacterium]
MEAIKEVGLAKTIRFVIYTILYRIYRLWPFPIFRGLMLGLMGAKIGKSTVIMDAKFFNFHHAGFSHLNLGDNCFIGDETLIDLYDNVILESNVTIAQRVTILTHMNVGYISHPLQKQFPKKSAPVILQEGSVIGAASTILSGIKIGKNSFVAAGSVVTKDVLPRTLVAGVPAKIIKKISE